MLLDPPATSKTATPENVPELGERIETLHTRVRALEAQLTDIWRLLALGNERITALWQAQRPENPRRPPRRRMPNEHPRSGIGSGNLFPSLLWHRA